MPPPASWALLRCLANRAACSAPGDSSCLSRVYTTPDHHACNHWVVHAACPQQSNVTAVHTRSNSHVPGMFQMIGYHTALNRSRASHNLDVGRARALKSPTALGAQHRLFSGNSRGRSTGPSTLPAPPAPACRRVVITGMGLVTPLGVGVTSSWQALLGGQSGVRAIQEEDLPLAHRPLLAQLPSRVAGLVPRGPLREALDRLKEDPRRTAPFMQYALLAAEEALQDARWDPLSLGEVAQDTTGVSMGCGMSSCAEVADAWTLLAEGKLRRLSPYFVPRILSNMAAGAIGIRWGLQGPNVSVSTACATGLHAIGDAYRMVQRGDAEVMVAGATESCVDALSLAGFSRLKALSTRYNDSPSQASRPFDAGRDGFVMGEGAGAVVLETAEHAAARGARVYAEVRGYGLSGDGHHITQPHPEGRGARACMLRALRGAGLYPGHVTYINAHATSTPQGDDVEAAALAHIFHSQTNTQPTPKGEVVWPAVSSTKGATGHLLGAAGAVEVIFTVLALHHRLAPPTVNLTHPTQPAILPTLVGPVALPLPAAPNMLAGMCNSFGFGGTNACLLLTTPEQ